MRNALRIISTGGTIDSSIDYDPKKKSVFQGTNLPKILKQSRLTTEVELEPLMQKDSADITEEDRRLILERCRQSDQKYVVITHGTDTMAETAQFIGKQGIENKTIIIVGSFVPFSQESSDAFFNLGFAIAAAQSLPPGVWIGMGGEIFAWNEVRKNKEKQLFERV